MNPPPAAGAQPQSRPSRRRYHARRRLLIERGQWEPLADAEQVRIHLRKLSDAGLGRRQIAARAGLTNDSAISRILYGAQAKVTAAIAVAILSVEVPGIRAARAGQEPATATTRRLQALAVLGWSPLALAGRLGMHLASVRRIRDGEREDVEAATATAIRALYDELWDQAPPAATKAERIAVGKVSRHAARSGWAPPVAWDDETISDPAAAPAPGWERGDGDGPAHGAEMAREAAFLLAAGEAPERAADRLGVPVATLGKALERARKRSRAA